VRSLLKNRAIGGWVARERGKLTGKIESSDDV